MRLLSVDSTATACSVALTENGKVLGEFYCNTKLTHSQTLMVMIQQMMNCRWFRCLSRSGVFYGRTDRSLRSEGDGYGFG